jgi:hypothetical protein
VMDKDRGDREVAGEGETGKGKARRVRREGQGVEKIGKGRGYES